jgi:hypothetical protein
LPVNWVDGRLVVTVGPLVGDPQESSERLYWTKGRLFRRIERLFDLKRRVRLRTSGDALQFVRLLTSPVTFHLFARWHPEIVEVGSPEDFDLRAYFGDKNRRESMMELEEVVSPNRREVWPYVGYFGILSRTLMAKNHLKPTWVELMPGGFRIHRTLLIDSTHKRPAQATMAT